MKKGLHLQVPTKDKRNSTKYIKGFIMKKKERTCEHGIPLDDKSGSFKSGYFCCRCVYGPRSYLEYQEQQGRDTVGDMSMAYHVRLAHGFQGR